MKHVVARLLVTVLLANLVDLASAEVAQDPDSNNPAASYLQDTDSDNIPDVLGCCSHACHVACHFVALIGAPLLVAASLDEFQIVLSEPPIFATPAPAPFRPPRSLS
jgi:hypothetical protein